TRLAANPDTQRGGQMATVEQPAAEDAATGRRAVRRAAMIGTGTMGPGMGAVLERAGIAVAMYDVSKEALERSKAGVGVAEGVVGTHWSNPPHLIPMIEVIPGERTNAETVDAAVALVERLGYEAVVEREVPGFVENRILYAVMREAVDLVDRGIIDADGIDR